MSYTVDLFQFIAHLPRFRRAYSGWEFRRDAELANVYMKAFAE